MEDRPKYQRLIQTIKHNISDGVWKAGDKLPSENALCEHFDVSKTTVKKAKEELINEGVLELLPGRKGAFIRTLHRISPTGFIGVAVDDIQNVPFIDILKGIEDKLWEHKLHLTLCNVYWDVNRVETYLQSLLQNTNVAGVIFAPLIADNYFELNRRILDRFIRQHVPYVLVDRFLTKGGVNAVASDNYEASKELTSLLIRQGHSRIMGLAGVECSSMEERIHGYLDAFEAAGIAHDSNLLIRVKEQALVQPQEAVLELERIKTLAEKAGDFTACYPMNMRLQIPVKTVYPLSKAAQQPLALITYDEASEHLRGLNDHVYVVKQPGYKMGWEAAKLLLDGIHEPDQRIVQIKLKSEIVEKAFE